MKRIAIIFLVLCSLFSFSSVKGQIESGFSFDFETGLEGFKDLAWGIAVDSLYQSDAKAFNGVYALAGEATFTAANKVDIAVEPDTALDLSNINYIIAHVYVPDATGLGGKIFGGWGSGWSWGEGTWLDFTDGWNTLIYDISDQADKNELHRLGVEVYSSASTYSGVFYIDYIAFFKDKPFFTNPTKVTILYDFETDTHDFIDYSTIGWGGITVTLSQSSAYASSGSYSLAMEGTFAPSTKMEVGIPEGTVLDLSQYNYIRAHVYIPDATGLGGKLQGKFGSAQAYVGGTWYDAHDGWNTWIFDISNQEGKNETRLLNVQVWSNTSTYSGPIYLDQIELSTETPPTPPPPPTAPPAVLFDFETDTEGFYELGWQSPSVFDSLSRTSEYSRNGVYSLAMYASFQAATKIDVAAEPDTAFDLSRHGYIIARIYFPDATSLGGKIIGGFGPGWDFVASGWYDAVPGWNTWVLDITEVPGKEEVHRLGVEVYSNNSTYSGPIYLDYIQATSLPPPKPEELTLLYDFETGTEGFIDLSTAGWGGLTTTLSQSDAYAYHGTYSLSMEATFGAQTKMEVGTSPDSVYDLSDQNFIIARLYIPDATGLGGKIHAQFGSGWAYGAGSWYDAHNGWNTWVFDISQQADKDIVHTIGIQVWSDTSTYSGPIYLDQIELSSQQPITPPPPPPPPVAMTTLYDFETGTEGFQDLGWDIAVDSLYQSDAYAWSGTYSLAAEATFAPNRKIDVAVEPETALDFSGYDYITARLYLPQATGLGAKLFGGFGSGWSWGEGTFIDGVDGWNTLVFDISGQADIDEVHRLGVEVYSSSSNYSGPVYIDQIALSIFKPPEPPPVPEEGIVVLDDFETLPYWVWTPGESEDSVYIASDVAVHGQHSLTMLCSFNGEGWDGGKIELGDTTGGATMDFSNYDSLAVYVFFPEGQAKALEFNLFIKDMYWTWRQTQWDTVWAGRWNRFSWDITNIPHIPNLQYTHQYGIQVGSKAEAYYGPVYIDYYIAYPKPSGVADESDAGIPKKFSLSQNYPNPFNPTTRIKYALPKNVHVKLRIYNVLGQLVKTLIDENKKAGHHIAYWNGKNDFGLEVSSGIYFYRLEADEFVSSKKLILLR